MPDDPVGSPPPPDVTSALAAPPWANPALPIAPTATASSPPSPPWAPQAPDATPSAIPKTDDELRAEARQGVASIRIPGRDDFSAHPLDNPNQAEGQAQLNQMAVKDPIGYEAYKTAIEDKSKYAAIGKQLEAVKKYNSDLDTDNQAHQAALGQLGKRQAEIDAAVTKLQPNITQDLSTGQKIAGVAASILGGLVAPYQGGKNAGLDAYEARIDRNIKVQQAQFDQQKQKIGLQQQSVSQGRIDENDNYKQQQVYKAAAFQGIANQLQLEQQNYDPRGSQSLDIAGHIQDAVGRMQTAKQAAAQLQFSNDKEIAKNRIDEFKANTEARTQAEIARHNQADEGLAARKESREASAAKASDLPVPIEQLAAQNPTAPVPPAAAFPGGAMKPSQYTKWLNDQKTSGEISGATVKNAQETSAGQVFSPATGKPYTTTDDGKPVQISPTVAVEVNKRSVGAQQYLDAMSAVKRELVADPSTIDRKKWAEINSNLETAKASWTQMYGAKASSREMEAASDVVGANFDGYAARVKDKGTAIESIGTQIDSTKRNLNTELKGLAGIRTKADLVDTSEPPPSKPTAADKTVETLTTNYGASDVDASALDANDRAFTLASRAGITERSPQEQAQYATNNGLAPEALRALHTGVAPSQIKELDGLEADAIGADTKARAAAIDRLAVVAGSSKSPAVRSYARALIGKASADATSSIPAAADDLEPEVH